MVIKSVGGRREGHVMGKREKGRWEEVTRVT